MARGSTDKFDDDGVFTSKRLSPPNFSSPSLSLLGGVAALLLLAPERLLLLGGLLLVLATAEPPRRRHPAARPASQVLEDIRPLPQAG